MNSIPIYVINFKHEERKRKMLNRFEKLGFNNIIFTPEVYCNDYRIKSLEDKENYSKIEKRTWSIMLQHLDSIKHFYTKTKEEYCIVCEDDIMISKNFNKHFDSIRGAFTELNLDILLLGFLFPHKIEDWNTHFKKIYTDGEYKIMTYPDDIWGSQMYMISKKYAKYLIDTFDINFAYNNIDSVPFSSDWIITKRGNRAAIYPMVAVEEGVSLSNHTEQSVFHTLCFMNNYNADLHI